MDWHYTNNWNNITQGKVWVKQKVNNAGSDGAAISTPSTVYGCDVPPGRYETVSDLLDEINETLKTFQLHRFIAVKYHKTRDLAYIAFEGGDYEISFSDDVAVALGFRRGRSYSRPSETRSFCLGNDSPDIHQGVKSLFVYCNLCADRMVGNKLVPLLRVMPVRYNEREGKNVYEEVMIPHYVDVAETDTDIVEIDIKRDNGQDVKFRGGKVCINVHLRRVD